VAAAQLVCEHYGLPSPRYINLSQAFYMIGGSSLTSGNREGNPSEEAVDRTPSDLPPSFVPGRNIIMLAVAAAVGYTEKAYDIVGGWNAVDYSGYPDCRPEFINSMISTLNIGLGLGGNPADKGINIFAPLVYASKSHIIQLGLDLQAPLHLTWSCYSGGSVPCMECDSCKIRQQGFETLGVPDPALAHT
jgi:7-cyano-7-deazaguanine synthase